MRLNKILYTIAGVALLASCHDLDLNPLSKGSTGNWYSNETEVEMAVNELYDINYWPEDGQAHNDWSDDYQYRDVLTPFDGATLNGQNDFVVRLWDNQYKAIAHANSVILNEGKAIANGANAQTIKRLVAEARFHRAAAYSKLVVKFGDVPLVLNSIDIDEGKAMGRTEKSKVLQAIYEDFDAAASVLPEKCTGVVRATKGAALALKARVALIMGDWQTAATAAHDVMELGVYALHPDYANLFLSTTKTSDEFIFKIPRSVEYDGWYYGANAVYNDLVRNVGGWCATCPSWDLLAAYTCTDGLPIDKSPLFDSHDPFKNRDPRCCMTIVPFGSNFLGYEYNPSPEATEVMNFKTGEMVYNNDTRANKQYASFDGLAWKKGIDETWLENGFKVGADIIYCRYAEILLTYAEAKIEMNEIDQSVVDAMNSVRARAYGVDKSQTDSYPAFSIKSQKDMRYDLRVERRMEMAKEHMRYTDMIRWRQAEISNSRKSYGMLYPAQLCIDNVTSKGDWFWPCAPRIDENGLPDFSNIEATGKCQVLTQRVWDDRQYLWPIPTSEVLINKKMHQNDGY